MIPGDDLEDDAGVFLSPNTLTKMGGMAEAQKLPAMNNSYDAFFVADALMITG